MGIGNIRTVYSGNLPFPGLGGEKIRIFSSTHFRSAATNYKVVTEHQITGISTALGTLSIAPRMLTTAFGGVRMRIGAYLKSTRIGSAILSKLPIKWPATFSAPSYGQSSAER